MLRGSEQAPRGTFKPHDMMMHRLRPPATPRMLPSTATLLLSLPRHSSPSCLMTRRSFAGRATRQIFDLSIDGAYGTCGKPKTWWWRNRNLLAFPWIHWIIWVCFFSFSELSRELFYSFGMTSYDYAESLEGVHHGRHLHHQPVITPGIPPLLCALLNI
jgi:hypothetical protein